MLQFLKSDHPEFRAFSRFNVDIFGLIGGKTFLCFFCVLMIFCRNLSYLQWHVINQPGPVQVICGYFQICSLNIGNHALLKISRS